MLLMAGVLGLAAFVPDVESLDAAKLAQLKAERPRLFWLMSRLRPQAVAESPFFLALPAFLFAAVSLSIVNRVKAFRSQRRRGRPALQRFRFERRLELEGDPASTAARLGRVLRRARYEVATPEPGLLLASRGKPGFYGSILFHVGLLLVLAAVVASALTRVNGEIVVTEGFAAALRPETFVWLTRPGRLPPLQGHSLSIRDFVAEYSPAGTPVDYSVLLSVHRGRERIKEEQVRVNQAFSWNGLDLTLHRYGFAPSLVASNREGQSVLDATGVLRVIPAGKEDSLALQDGGRLLIKLYPDFAVRDRKPVSRSPEARRPVVAFRWLDHEGRQLARGRVELGARVTSRGYTVAFPKLSYWAGFVVAADRGLWLLAIGSLVGSLGLLLRFGFPDQTLCARLEAQGGATALELSASTRFFPALHEQHLESLIGALQPGRGETEDR